MFDDIFNDHDSSDNMEDFQIENGDDFNIHLDQIDSGDLFAGKTLEDGDPLMNSAYQELSEIKHFIEHVKDMENEKLISMGLEPKTGDFVEDLNHEIHNVMELTDRAENGDMEAQQALQNWENSTHRQCQELERQTMMIEHRLDRMRHQEWLNEFHDFQHHQKMERQYQFDAENSATGDPVFKEYIEKAEEHRKAAKECQQNMKDLER
ncbi:hypothetical protein DESC_90013 [Desulfosarcina cetonica]|uniref:hypothetical protein n=1 Tax=Desulfosarcina cetonica TaxID=90730 RepID=UPI0006CF9E01|nr:hypothetical protein [Desulfosarcina cetonica]VTR71143.1 hypothetical protein DESC_90013 [Desulfosarcina cetonica]